MTGTAEQNSLFEEKVVVYDKLWAYWKENRPRLKDFNEIVYGIEKQDLERKVNMTQFTPKQIRKI